MSFRGRGRGRGGGRGGGRGFDNRVGKKVPYILFPEDVVLPSLPSINPISEEETRLVSSKLRLEHFWLGSCYHLNEESFTKLKGKSKGGKEEDVEIERYSHRVKQRTQSKRETLESYLKQTPLNFPSELILGARHSQRATKKLRWDRNLGAKEFDFLAKLEAEESKDEDGKKAKENESGDEEDEEKGEEDEEYSDDGDYNQNIDFDDDEDDMNMEEEIAEDYYE